MELCDKFALDAEGIFNQWMAYASVKNPGDGKSLTLDLLGPFETWMGQTTKSSSAASQSTPKAVKKVIGDDWNRFVSWSAPDTFQLV